MHVEEQAAEKEENEDEKKRVECED